MLNESNLNFGAAAATVSPLTDDDEVDTNMDCFDSNFELDSKTSDTEVVVRPPSVPKLPMLLFTMLLLLLLLAAMVVVNGTTSRSSGLKI